MWVATSGGGLSRYDGYEFVHYNLNTPSTTLKSNFINGSCEDNFGRLWITSGEGIDVLDLSANRIIIPHDPAGVLQSISQYPASGIYKDSKGDIWLYINNTLHKITFLEDGGIEKIYTLSPSTPSVTGIVLLDIDNDGDVWAGVGNKIFKVQVMGNSLNAIPITGLFDFEEGLVVQAFCVKENEVWIGTDRGLVRFNQNQHILKWYLYDGYNPRSLTQNYITGLVVTSEKQLLISTLRGLNVYNPVTDDFEQIMLDPRERNNFLSSNFIDCLFTDGDIIWVGTETGGLNKLTPKNLYVRNYIHSELNPQSLSPNPVNSIYEDADGTLWVGSTEGGLNRKSKDSDKFTHYTVYSSGLSHNSVSAITRDPKNQLWIGTWGNGITIASTDGDKLAVEKFLSGWMPPGYPMNFVGSLCYDPINNLMWFGTHWGIYYYDYDKDYMYSPFMNETVANEIHSSLGAVIDAYGQLWMGCTNGLYVFDLHSEKNGKFTYNNLKYKLDDPTSQLGEKISCIQLSSDGTLWIGSNGNGFFRHIPNEDGTIGTFTGYNIQHGLISNVVRGILEDNNKKLWISTNNGLSCFDPVTNTFVNYTRNDGLIDNQFYWNAYSHSQSGLLYFGGLEGLTAIDPARINIRNIPNTVTLTKLSVMNREIFPDESYIQTDISTAKTLYLHESDKSFSLEFSALNYDAPSTAIYSYRLSGFDDQWINVPLSRRFANYTNLPAGKYKFQVKYSPDGITDGPLTELAVIVRPFFYKTGWFISLMIILAICLIASVYLQRISTLEKQKQLLHRKVEERTRELNEQKLILENQTEELSRQNQTLIEQNEQITNQKAEIITMSQKVQELTMDKISFFTNITHEFRTPITLIMGPIQRALKLSYNPQVIEQLNFVERNSKYLLSLVNQLMDFRKIESGRMEISKSRGNFSEFINNIIIPFQVFAGDRQITLNKYMRLNAPEFLFDQDAMQKVISNLLSNAIKFTPNGGIVSLYITTMTDHTNNKENLYICVRDTGTGIPEDDLSQIFERFYQSGNHVKYPVYGQSGTGIGLYLCKHIVNLHGGCIEAANNNGKGANFRILMPLQRNESEVVTRLTTQDPVVPLEPISELQGQFIPGRLTILIVEDNMDMRSYIRSILIEQYNILEAENGEKALQILKQNNVDFVVSDLMMPVMDGLELSRKVKENFAISHIPFLMLTAKTAPEARLESYKIGVDAYLMKPFSEELLLTRISNILENRKRYQHQFMNKMDVSVLEMEKESGDKKFLDKALEIIRANYKNSYYETGDFIDAMGVSKSLLNKKLQTLTGQSIGQFIRNYRLNIAREMIEKNKITKNMNISEIAYEVGFNDPKYFTRCFTKRFNVPPSSLMEE